MKRWVRYAPVGVLLFGLAVTSLYIRVNAAAFVPIADSLRFAFQLMLAATAIAILRNEAGISTFGVFGPAILAFAWLDLGPLWGFLLISYVFVVGVSARIALDGLDLGTPHRVATLLIIAAVSLFVIESVGRLQGIPPLRTIVLFPIILSTWYAERFVGNVSETGWTPAMRRLTLTVIAICLSFVVMSYEPLVMAVVQTPESWVGLVALNVALGIRTDFRITEYARFRLLRRALGAAGSTDVLTMRVRNRDFVNRYNPSGMMAAFDKARLKERFHGLDIPTPETYLVVEDDADLEALRSLIQTCEEFVIKPVRGGGGEDILVVRGRTDEGFVTNRGHMSDTDIVGHARRICVGGIADYGARTKALVEALVTPESLLGDRVAEGVPDLRVITLHGHPVMAMVRLPTAESRGTANIHGGAVAVAVNIADGTASGGYQQTRNRYLDTHPDTGSSLEFVIPDWEEVLTIASRASIASGLGYTGVDIVFDAALGPVVLEVNRRPGLGIQNANMAGLLRRLRVVEARASVGTFTSARDRVRQAMAWAADGWRDSVRQPTVEESPEVAA